MTSTSCDDQFTVGTQPIEPVHQPYDIVPILRRNIADLEVALRTQAERAEAAEAELLAVREDNHSMMLEIDGLRTERDALAAELAKLREQKPALYMAFSECGQFIRYWTRDTKNLDATMAVNDFTVLEFFARPTPAPAVPEYCKDCGKHWTDATAHANLCVAEMLRQDTKQAPAMLEEPLLCGTCGADCGDNPWHYSTGTQRHLHACDDCWPLQAPIVPEEWREVMAELAADLQSACDAEHPHRDQYPSVMRKYNNDMEIVEKARALLQSADHSEQAHEMVDAVNRRCEACAILPCSCK